MTATAAEFLAEKLGAKKLKKYYRAQCPFCGQNRAVFTADKYFCPNCKDEPERKTENVAGLLGYNNPRATVTCRYCGAEEARFEAGKFICPTCRTEEAMAIYLDDARRKKEESEKLVQELEKLPKGYTAAQLAKTNFPDPTWVVPDLIPAGLTILAGKPKLGKSWLALCLGTALAQGGRVLGSIQVEQGHTLYLALEDNPRRMKDRLKAIGAETAGDKLDFRFEWGRGQEATQQLELYLKAYPQTKLIIVDTLQKIRAETRGKKSFYEQDYEAIGLLKNVADKYNIAILAVHHVRKGETDDPLEAVSGSFGLTGAADTIAVLRRSRGEADATLYITGRDLTEEKDVALQKDVYAGWVLLGDAAEYQQTKERREILNVLAESKTPMKPKEIAEAIGKNQGAIRRLLGKLEKEGLIKSPSYGKYILGNTGNSGNSSNTGNSGNTSQKEGKSVTECYRSLPGAVTVKTPFEQGKIETVTGVTAVTYVNAEAAVADEWEDLE